jgi:hypothetical protein
MPSGFHNRALGGRGGLAGGERRPELVNMRRGSVIGLTTRRLTVVAWPEMTPASGGGEVAAARVLAKLEEGEISAQPLELEGDLGKG